jgi:phosphomevalonate kinase
MRISAPGKAFLCGEYAVLSGAPAVVMAVNRYAYADDAQASSPRYEGAGSPFARAAAKSACLHLQKGEATRLPAVDTRELLSAQGEKLGLGSSAATTVAVAACFFARAGTLADRAALTEVCIRAHTEAQRGVGSGADIAASVHGGMLRFEKREAQALVTRLAPPHSLHLSFTWTAKPAATGPLAERVLGSRATTGELGSLAERFAAAVALGDVGALIELGRLYHEALVELGQRADAPIVTPEHALAADLARDHGGSAKPSGAGGGDLNVAFFRERDAKAAYEQNARREGLVPLELAIDHQGVKEA